MALSNVTLVRPVICRSLIRVSMDFTIGIPVIGVYTQGVYECYIIKQLLTIEAVDMM